MLNVNIVTICTKLAKEIELHGMESQAPDLGAAFGLLWFSSNNRSLHYRMEHPLSSPRAAYLHEGVLGFPQYIYLPYPPDILTKVKLSITTSFSCFIHAAISLMSVSNSFNPLLTRLEPIERWKHAVFWKQ